MPPTLGVLLAGARACLVACGWGVFEASLCMCQSGTLIPAFELIGILSAGDWETSNAF